MCMSWSLSTYRSLIEKKYKRFELNLILVSKRSIELRHRLVWNHAQGHYSWHGKGNQIVRVVLRRDYGIYLNKSTFSKHKLWFCICIFLLKNLTSALENKKGFFLLLFVYLSISLISPTSLLCFVCVVLFYLLKLFQKSFLFPLFMILFCRVVNFDVQVDYEYRDTTSPNKWSVGDLICTFQSIVVIINFF